MFKRREKPKLSFQIRQLVWPNMGFKRYVRYLTLRIVRLAHMPEALARAIACGLTVTFFPVFGVHAVMAFALALLIGAHPFAAAASALIVPAVALPLVFSLDYLVGRKILHFFGFYTHGSESGLVRRATEGTDYIVNNLDEFMRQFSEFFLPALLGSVLFMLLTWPASYMAAHKLIAVLEGRHKIHKERRMRRRAAKKARVS